MRSVPASNIREYLEMPSLKMADYTKGQRIVKGIYRITDEGTIVSEKKEKKQQKPAIPADMWEAWKEVCNRFNGISGLDKIILVPEDRRTKNE